MQKKVNIRNKRSRHDYNLIEHFTAGIQLYGTEIKSIRSGKASLADSFCYFRDGELFVKMHIAEYKMGGYTNHDPKRERKLLLTKRELRRLESKVKTKGHSIIPTRMFLSDAGWAKLDIALAQGKKQYDKREDLKRKDAKREMQRAMKNFR